MKPNETEPITIPRSRRWPRRLLILAALLAMLIAAAAIGVRMYLRSEAFSRYVSGEIQKKLLEYGVRSEVGGFSLTLESQTVRMRGLKLFNAGTKQPLATVEELDVQCRLRDPWAFKLSREIAIEEVRLRGVELFVERDEKGRTNFDGLHDAPPDSKALTFDTSKLATMLERGTVRVKDRGLGLEAEIGALSLDARPAGGAPEATRVSLRSTAGWVRDRGRELPLNRLELGARVTEKGLDLDRFELTCPAGELTAQGKLEEWASPRYGVDLRTRLRLDEIARFAGLGGGMGGAAQARLRLDGEGESYRARGEVGAEEVRFDGDWLRGVEIAQLQIESKGRQLRFGSGRIRVGATEISDVRINEVAIDGVKGEMVSGTARFSTGGVTSASVEWTDSRLDAISLGEVTGELTEAGRYRIQAAAKVSGGCISGAQFTGAQAQAELDNDSLRVDQIVARAFDGTVNGAYLLPFDPRAASRATATFSGLQTRGAAALFDLADLPVAGQVSGDLDLSFVGSDARSLNGTIRARFEGQANEKTEALPLNGDASLRLDGGDLQVEHLSLTTGPTTLTAEGRLTHEKESALRVKLSSTQAEQLVQLARSYEPARAFIVENEPQLIGDVRFEGQITGRIEDPRIEGQVHAGTVGLRDAILGALDARVTASATEFRVENGSIVGQGAGAVKFNLSAPFDAKASTGRLDAVIEQWSLETMLAAVGSPDARQFVSGDLSGEAHLTGLPGAIGGAAELRLVNGRIADQPADLARARLAFQGREARLELLEVKLPQSHLSADGAMNLDDYTFQFKGKADQIALGNLAETFELGTIRIEGAADAEFQISGRALIEGKKTELDYERLRVELTARGQGVKVNGRDAGELRLVAHTSAGGRIDAELATGMLTAGAKDKTKPEIIKASVELQKPGRPILIESELNELDLSTILSTFQPDMASALTGTFTARLRIEGPTADEKGAVGFDRLRGGLTLTKANLSVYDNPVTFEMPVTVALDGTQIRMPLMRFGGQGVDLKLGGTLGLAGESGMNFTLNGAIQLDRLPSFATGVVLYGGLKIDARLTGTLNEPKLAGAIDISGFGLSTEDQPIFINDGRGRITLEGDQLKVERMTAKANDGMVEISGLAKLVQFRPSEWRYDIKANNAEIVLQGFRATISGGLTLAGTPAGQVLSGTVVVPRAEYEPGFDIDNLAAGGGSGNLNFGGFDSGDRMQRLGLPPINLNVRVEARDSLVIRNVQINTVGSGALTVAGRLDDPDPYGRITLDGGTLRFRGQRYEITTGALDLPQGAAAPLLNLVAEANFSGYRVYIGLIGPTDNIDLTLRSEPELARTEILNLITTGRTEASSIAGQDPLISGVGAAASLLTTGLISKPAEQLLGLSRFQIDPIIRPNLNPAARLTIGQQLFRNFYVSYSTNLATEQDQTALAEYTLSNRFSTLATFTQGGSAARQSVREGVFSLEFRGRQRFSLGFSGPAMAGGSPDALTRLARPRLPMAQVAVSAIPGFRLSLKKQRELLPVITQGYSRSLARLGESRLKEFLQESGYFFAQVKTRCEPESCEGERLKVFYEVEPNVIYDLKDIRIQGTDIVKLRQVEDRLQSKTASTLGGKPFLRDLPILGGYVRGLTSNDRLNNDAEFLRLYLADIGYRAARVRYRLAVSPDSDDLIVIFDVEAGPQSEVAEVAVRGNAILPATDLLGVVPVLPGEAFSYTRLRAGMHQIKELYARNGYLEVDANPEIVELGGDRVRLVYNINEGARAVVRAIDILGTTKTGKGWVQRYFDFKPGELLTPAKIRQTQRDLYSTNAFREVNVRAEPLGGDDGSAHRVTVNLTEAKPLLFVYGLGYSTDDGARGLLELANTNFRGTLDSLSLRVRAGSREQFSQLSFTDLRPFGTRLPTTVSVFYNRNSNLIPFVRRRVIDNNGNVTESDKGASFGLNRFAAFIQTQRKLSERTSLRLRYNLERASLFNINADSFPETEVTRNERAIRLGMFSLGLSRDTRDSVINPTRGYLLSADHSIAARILGGNESFNKFFGTYQTYKTFGAFTPVLKDTTLALSARIGMASVFRVADRNGDGVISESEMRLPISERFFSGGATTLRGFRFETAGPQAVLEPRPDRPGELPTLVPLGGDALAILNFELRYPLSQRFRLVPFYDLGNVFRRVSDFNFSRMTNTVGVGFRINTPLGPVGVDYGFLIDPPAYGTASGAVLRQPRGTIHIRFGQSF